MTPHARPGSVILVVDSVEETRDGIEKLLTAVGHQVQTARSEIEAIEKASRHRPDLILVCLGGPAADLVESARRIRAGAGLSEDIPIVVFCVPTVSEGAEVSVGKNVYVTRPDNFNQLRAFVGRLIGGP